MSRSIRSFLFLMSFVFVSCGLFGSQSWDWNKINVNDIEFPKEFYFGVGSSSYQVEGGCTNNQWCEHEGVTQDADGKLRMPEYSGKACDNWNRYQEDVQLIKNSHANAYRFSVEWSKIEPREGQFDESALQHYVDLCDELIANGIAPVVTIFHYTEPKWFAQKGGFEHEENIQYFVRFAARLFDTLGSRVKLWLTFNSPGGYAMPSYAVGMKPPYKKNKQLGVQVMKNLLEAHVQTYKKLKSMPGGVDSKIGILKNICQLDPVYLWDPMARLYGYIADRLMNRPFFNFFTTGVFNAYVPGLVNVYHENSDAPHALDFVGVNYYSHMGIKGFGRCAYPGERLVKKEDHTIYAQGLYRALHEVNDKLAKKLNIPLYVTENGIAPIKEEDRDLFLKRYIYALSEAVKDGIDVRGYFYWSLMDNYEWGSYADRYGLYHVDFKTQKRTLKKSAQHFIDVAHKFAS